MKFNITMTSSSLQDKLKVDFDVFRDERGTLSVAQSSGKNKLPFAVQRVFWITEVPVNGHRGKHAHQSCWEVLVAVHGEFKVRITDGKERNEVFLLNNSHEGLLIPPMMWCELYDFTSDAVCLCMASGNYDKDGYVSDYQEFLNLVK